MADDSAGMTEGLRLRTWKRFHWLGSEVMRATNSWVISWGRRIRLAELDGRLVVGHQLGE